MKSSPSLRRVLQIICAVIIFFIVLLYTLKISLSRGRFVTATNLGHPRQRSTKDFYLSQNGPDRDQSRNFCESMQKPTVPVTILPGGVPRIIHQVYKSLNVYKKYLPMIQHCMQVNSDFQYVLWTDDDASALIQQLYPQKYDSFQLYEGHERLNVIKYFVLNHFGGVYMDMDTECFRPLVDTLQNIPCILNRDHEIQSKILHLKPFTISGSFMACRPNHTFFTAAIDKMSEHVMDSRQRDGYLFLTTVYNEYLGEMKSGEKTLPNYKIALAPTTWFSPIMDLNKVADVQKLCFSDNKDGDEKRFATRYQACKEWAKKDYSAGEMTNETVVAHRFLLFGSNEKNSPQYHIKDLAINMCQLLSNVHRYWNKAFFGASDKSHREGIQKIQRKWMSQNKGKYPAFKTAGKNKKEKKKKKTVKMSTE